MSSLAKDQAAFKSVLARQNYTSWHSQPAPARLAGEANKSEEEDTKAGVKREESPEYQPPGAAKKKKRAKTEVVYSQPADTGTGADVNTQLVYVVNELKTSHNPRRLDDLAIITSIPVDTDPTLLTKFRAHDKVQWDPKTDLYSYKHEFAFRSKAELLTEIQRRGGISVRALKESWKDAPQAVEELEQEGDVLVTRTARDGALKMVFWNEIKPNEESGGQQVDKEFVDLWHGLKVPNDVDLLRQLAGEGLQVTTSEQSAIPKGPATKRKGKKGSGSQRQRQVKLTNTHLKGEIDLSKDYQPPGK